ncbi:uncharacterized protein TRIADDRAFT_59618 [Trichoplax adhaerens]|uniref:glutathione transferase n=1 Tax=Trichoplax adhaerens TaxID=10228 RepID=B3S5H6_TRIAD|nr:hypothetical protein TRIADDRAFT_59618 [Trichoplax adhaerens]EDV22041.1 hypothetical protein TRIADDRAFT_59618 [Trichoplax adhaerens]|eukprot:XP_002115678.1 hypothetical protein TRIADDRAFT_59618 [Trichoplax adhaerens]
MEKRATRILVLIALICQGLESLLALLQQHTSTEEQRLRMFSFTLKYESISGKETLFSMAKLEFYFDPLSEPCRSVQIFLDANNIPYEPKYVDLLNDANRTEEYKKIIATQTVPAITHGELKLFESVAILQYLAEAFSTPDHWYPSEMKKRARINEYLHWHHLNARCNAGLLVIMNYIYTPYFYNQKVSEEEKKASIVSMERVLDTFESYFLKDNKFIAGDEISIADLMAIGEFIAPDIIGIYVGKHRPRVAAWHDNVKAALGPVYDSAHADLYKHMDDIKDLVPPVDY